MTATLELESTLTDRYQTTVPDAVRRALKLGKRDKIRYAVQADGMVTLSRVATENDPVLGSFLDFLARDIMDHPQHVRSVDAGLAERALSLVKDVEVDINAPLTAEDE
ncbi:MAG: type II toxin-antitoxin system PrlF family antitoxin [Sulfuricellaceae bacterium]